MSEKGMKSSHDGSMNEEFADSPRLRGRFDGDISISSSSSDSPSFTLLSLFRLVRRKKRSRPFSFHEISSQVALQRNDTMTLPAVTCEWPSRVLCRPIARDTWTPLGSPPSLPPRGHPKGILDLASIARRLGWHHHVVFLLLRSSDGWLEDGYDASSSSLLRVMLHQFF